jgi:hypothetical protein
LVEWVRMIFGLFLGGAACKCFSQGWNPIPHRFLV